MNENIQKRDRLLAQTVIKGLKSRNMDGWFVETKQQALELALRLIPEGSSVGWGGSVSIAEIGLKEALIAGNYRVLDRDHCEDAEQKRQTELQILGSDYLLASTNAITEDGVLVNIDGVGNRVAGIVWGPKNVLMIVGRNKIVKTVDDAVARARNIAAPINAQRFDLGTPCCKTGVCMNCKAKDTICCQFLITRFSRAPGRIKVILVGEELGF